MKKPDYNKMRIMLGEEYKNLDDNDTMYEFLKHFEQHQIPKMKVSIINSNYITWTEDPLEGNEDG
tara:strand:+ start:275 stop:469 length:195 start_codon:yes stop_codon:yes gene_type:complete